MLEFSSFTFIGLLYFRSSCAKPQALFSKSTFASALALRSAHDLSQHSQSPLYDSYRTIANTSCHPFISFPPCTSSTLWSEICYHLFESFSWCQLWYLGAPPYRRAIALVYSRINNGGVPSERHGWVHKWTAKISKMPPARLLLFGFTIAIPWIGSIVGD